MADAESYSAQIRLRQNNCSAAKNSGVSLAVGIDDENILYERFIYADVSNGVRDRLMIGYSGSDDSSSSWKIQNMSEETGLLDKATHTTDYFTLTAEKLDNELFLSAGDKSISAVSEMKYAGSGKGMNSMKISSHSSDISIDGMTVKSLIRVTGIDIETNATPEVGEVCDFSVYGKNFGKKTIISPTEYQLTYDNSAVRIEDGCITFLKSGKTVIEAEAETRTGEILKDVLVLDIKECPGVYIEAPDAVLLNSTNNYRVVNDEGNRIECEVSSDTLTLSNGTFYAGTKGNHSVNISYCGRSFKENIYVSPYEEISFVLPESAEINKSAQFTMKGRKGSLWEDISYSDIIFDKNRASVSGNNFVLKKYGETEFTVVCDGVRTSGSVIAREGSAGEIFFEDFEKEPVYDGFTYDLSNKRNYMGSTMLMLDNTKTDRVDTGTYFKISGKLCVEKVYKDSYIPFFGINLYNEKSPVICSIGDYIRIGGVSGEESVDISDGKMHSFSVVSMDRGIEFTVDGITRASYADFGACKGFSISASGMKAYIDDIKYEKLTMPGGTPDRIEAVNSKITLNRYDSYSFEEINGIKAIYGNSYRYLSEYNTLSRSIIRGVQYAKVKNGIISFDKNAPENTLVRIQAEYKSFSCTYDIILTSGGKTESEYLKSTVGKRRRDFVMRTLGDADKGISLKVNSGDLLLIYTRMIAEPYARDYTDDIRWHLRMAEYNDKIAGAADGAADFGLLQAIRAYHQLRGKIKADDDVFDEILVFLNECKYPDEAAALSENHRLVYYICEQLGSELTGRASVKEEIKKFFKEKLTNGFMEEASPHYAVVDLFALETLLMYTKDAELKKLSYDMATLLYAKQLINSIDASVAGAVVREYASFGNTMTFLPGTLMFGGGKESDESYPVRNVQLSGVLFSDYIAPDILFDIASGREYPYEYKTSSRVYSFPFDEKIDQRAVRYSYITDKYAMGSVINTDNLDEYKKQSGSYYPLIAGHQEIPWSLGISGIPECLILDSHPGSTDAHAFFSGDIDCLCYDYLQDKNVSLGMHRIKKSEEAQYTHMLIPKKYFSAYKEEKGWIFLEKNGVYIAIKPLKQGTVSDNAAYTWGSGSWSGENRSDIEAVINSADTAFVCEVGDNEKYQSLDAFVTDILSNTEIEYKTTFGRYYISYKSTDGRVLKTDLAANEKYINGIKQECENVPVIKSPYLECDNGTAKIIYGDNYYEMKV